MRIHRGGARRRASSGGFILMAIVILLALVAMGLGVMVVFADRVVETNRADAVTSELEEIYRAIVGNQRDTFGYIGEVGTYPASLIDLAINPGNAGWRGPYLRDPRVANSMLLDPWGQPYEFYIIDGVAGSDQLVIISRGPDGLSTNTASDPNVRTNFTGVAPTASTYFTSDQRNSDNFTFPRPDYTHSDWANINTDSILNVTIKNFDSNALINAFVSACPNLFTLTVTNTDRGTNDVPATPYAPGFQVTLPQGTYRVFVTSALLTQPLVNDRVVVFPVVPVYRTYNTTGVDSSGTDPYALTVTNQFPVDAITIYSFDSSLGTVAANGGMATFTPKACAAMTAKVGTTTVDTFTMPFGNSTRIVGASAASITVNNVNQNVTVQIFKDGLFIGDVRKAKSETFSLGLVAGNVITVKRVDNSVQVGGPLTLVAGSNSLTV